MRSSVLVLGELPFLKSSTIMAMKCGSGETSQNKSTKSIHEHTNKRYFKDVLLDPGIKAYHNLDEALSGADAVLFVVPTKVTRLVAKQVAELLDHPVKVMHASKGLEPNSHKRISQILEEEIPALYVARLWSYLVQVTLKKPSFATLL